MNVTVEQLYKVEKHEFIKSGGTRAEFGEAVRNGEINIAVVDTKHDGNYILQKFRLKNLYGTFEAWEQDGSSADEWDWKEV